MDANDNGNDKKSLRAITIYSKYFFLKQKDNIRRKWCIYNSFTMRANNQIWKNKFQQISLENQKNA